MSSSPLDRFRQLLVAGWLADPDPRPPAAGLPPLVLVPYGEVAAWLLREGADVLATLEAAKAAGWVEDLRLDLEGGARCRFVGIRREVLDAAAPDWPEVRKLAQTMKGQERALLERVCDAGGSLALDRIAAAVGWEPPWDDAWDSARRRLNAKLRPAGYRLDRQNNRAVLSQIRRKRR